jgi:hypothetical protein
MANVTRTTTKKNEGTDKEYDVVWEHSQSGINVTVKFPECNTMSSSEKSAVRNREITVAQAAFSSLRGITR